MQAGSPPTIMMVLLCYRFKQFAESLRRVRKVRMQSQTRAILCRRVWWGESSVPAGFPLSLLPALPKASFIFNQDPLLQASCLEDVYFPFLASGQGWFYSAKYPDSVCPENRIWRTGSHSVKEADWISVYRDGTIFFFLQYKHMCRKYLDKYVYQTLSDISGGGIKECFHFASYTLLRCSFK